MEAIILVEFHFKNGETLVAEGSLNGFTKAISDKSKLKSRWVKTGNTLIKFSEIVYVKEIDQ